jgi:hypothetical protein
MREAPEGAGSHTQLELIVMSIFYVLIPDIGHYHLLIKSDRGHKVT